MRPRSGRPRCRATRISSARSRSRSPTGSWPTSGGSNGISTASWPPRNAPTSLRSGRGRSLVRPCPVDPAHVADRLGFARAFENSIDAVSDRDPFAELLFDLALLAVHASTVGEEVVLFASKEFGFIARTAALGSGSSLMPQKRNPDVAELVRAKAGPRDREPGRPPHDPQGRPARVRPRPPGGQGARSRLRRRRSPRPSVP